MDSCDDAIGVAYRRSVCNNSDREAEKEWDYHMNRLHRWLCQSTMWKRALERKLLPWVLEGIDLGDDVLEVGPGPGLTTDFLRTRVARMTAIEVDSRLADSLKRRMGGTNVRVAEGDATDMPFEDESFSAVVSLTMLHHVPSVALQDRLLAEVYRVLRPNGLFAGMDNTWNIAFHLIHLGDTMVVVDPNMFGPRLGAAGFRKVVIDRITGRFRFRALRAG